MTDGFTQLLLPAANPIAATADVILFGPPIPPQQRILLYSADQWEGFVEEWAHYCLKKLYVQVQRFMGAGDRGIDIGGFADAKKLLGVWDNYQCKQFFNTGDLSKRRVAGDRKHPLVQLQERVRRTASVLLRFAARGRHDHGWLSCKCAKTEEGVMENWNKHARQAITETQEVILESEFLAYVEAFDFTIFDSKTALQVIEDHRGCPCHAIRFGGGLHPARMLRTPQTI